MNVGQSLLTASTLLTSVPTIMFDYCTFNNFGARNLNALLNAGSNPGKFIITNSVVAHIPGSLGTVNTAAINATGAGTGIVFSNNNTFHLTNGSNIPLTMPTTNIMQIGNQLINLGWTTGTTDFTLLAKPVLRTISSAGGAIGDPGWAY